jgi:hypothetical protein
MSRAGYEPDRQGLQLPMIDIAKSELATAGSLGMRTGGAHSPAEAKSAQTKTNEYRPKWRDRALAVGRHNCTTSARRSKAFGGGSRQSRIVKNPLNSAHGAQWRLTVSFGTDLKVMVSPFESGPRHFYLLMAERRREWGTKTRLIHDPGTEDDGTLAVSPPVNQTSIFELTSPEEGPSLATELAPATYYTRCCNPNTKGYQQTVSKEQLATWGTNLDLLVAFALGVLAHRIVRSLTSAGEV